MQPGPVIRNDMQSFNQISSRHRAHPSIPSIGFPYFTSHRDKYILAYQ